jgi:hypothetical protein
MPALSHSAYHANPTMHLMLHPSTPHCSSNVNLALMVTQVRGSCTPNVLLSDVDSSKA